MNYRNPIFTAAGGIDCEIEHPVHGWIPFHATADDPEPLGREVYAAAEPEAVAHVPDLARLKSNKLAEINDAYQAELNTILRDYPDAETRTWDKQEAEARAWQADTAAVTPLIDAIASARSMDKGELVSRIIAKADAWIALSGAATGKRQALEDTIAGAETVGEVEAVVW